MAASTPISEGDTKDCDRDVCLSGEQKPKRYLLKPGQLDVVNREGYPVPVKSSLSLDEKVENAKKVGEECVLEEELRILFEKKEHPICYDGFEPSGRMHIAQGVMKANNVNLLTDAGCVFVFWVADWFAMLNNKMGGDLKKIHKVGEYFIHVWKALGMKLDNVRFLWTSEEIGRDPENYWLRVMDVAQRNSITRMKRCGQIMGRQESDASPAAQIIYPCMQCADIFYIGADICQLGMDQRKVNMLAREYVDDWNAAHKKQSGVRLRKPVILSHKMLPGLLEGQAKMSKSDPDSAIFMEDSQQDIERKIRKAFCPPNDIENNPVVSYVVDIIFPKFLDFKLRVKDEEKERAYTQTDDFLEAYKKGEIHPSDLKPAVAYYLNQILEPVRRHFEENYEAKQLLAELKKYGQQK